MPQQRNAFITLEGIEGAGKSTHMAFIADYFESHNSEIILTREPGGSKLGEAIRSTLLSTEFQDEISEDSELLLMFAARAQHIANIIKPGLAAGKTVLCDRFTDSSFAYQGGGRGIVDEKIERLADWVQGSLVPELTFLFDLPVELGLERAGKRGAADRFESETIDFFERVRAKYLAMAHHESERFIIVDARLEIAEIHSQLQSHLQQRGFS